MAKLQAQLKREVQEQGARAPSERDYLSLLLDQADEFSRRLGIGKDVVLETYTETSDWTFVIKVDALIETACREMISRLRTTLGGKRTVGKNVYASIEHIGVQGGESALRLTEAMEGPKDDVRFLRCLKRARDAFAYDIRSVNMSLAEMIEMLGDRAQFWSAFSAMGDDGNDAARRAGVIRNDPGFLRFGILRQSMDLLQLMHAKLFESADDCIDAAPEAPPGASIAPALRLVGETGADASGRPLSIDSTRSGARSATAAAFFRHSFTNPTKPNRTRSLWAYVLAFAAKSLFAIGGLAAAAIIFSLYGILPAILVGAIALVPVGLDKWTAGAWKGHCPHCGSQIAVPPSKEANFEFGCPVCATRIVLRDKSFSML